MCIVHSQTTWPLAIASFKWLFWSQELQASVTFCLYPSNFLPWGGGGKMGMVNKRHQIKRNSFSQLFLSHVVLSSIIYSILFSFLTIVTSGNPPPPPNNLTSRIRSSYLWYLQWFNVTIAYFINRGDSVFLFNSYSPQIWYPRTTQKASFRSFPCKHVCAIWGQEDF